VAWWSPGRGESIDDVAGPIEEGGGWKTPATSE